LVGQQKYLPTSVGLKLNVKETTMTLKEQQKQIDQMQRRIAELVDELRTTQADVRQFKKAVANDLQRLVNK